MHPDREESPSPASGRFSNWISVAQRPTHPDTAARCSPGTPQASRGTPPGRFSPPAPCRSGAECGSLWRSFGSSWTRCPTTTSWHRPPSSPASSGAPRPGLRRGEKEQRAGGSLLLLAEQTSLSFTPPSLLGFIWLAEPTLTPPGGYGHSVAFECVCVCVRGAVAPSFTAHRGANGTNEGVGRVSQSSRLKTPLGCFFRMYSHA